jgi:alkane 1-monooxygenase
MCESSAGRYQRANMLQALPYLLGFVMPPLVVASAWLGGAWTLLPVAFLYGVLPLVDALAGLDVENPEAGEVASLSDNSWFRLITWAWVPVQLALLVWGLSIVTGATAGAWEAVGITLSIGLTTGAVGITFAHELIHRPGRFERALGEILLTTVSYSHFCIEHVHGHHRHVATPLDPATGRFGESFYAFYPRTVLGGVQSAWQIETDRLDRRGLSAWHPSNRMLRYLLVQVALYAGAASTFGAIGVTVLAGQAIVAFSMLEIINYVEHYGLERRQITPGRYERVMPWHSWNSSHRVSNWLLINLARHSDHHYIAAKRYQVLEHLDAAPQLPAGYGTMLLVVLLPPLWRRIMDPRVEQWRLRHWSTPLTS